MDGLSAAASGIAVVSLALQIIESVHKIQRFLRDVSDAPSEVGRLIDLLDHMELILENVALVIEKQRRRAGASDIDVSSSVLKSVGNCQKILTALDDVVESAKKGAGSSKAARVIAMTKLAIRKGDIGEFERQLDRTINVLNLTLTLNSNNFQLDQSQHMRQIQTDILIAKDTIISVSKDVVLMRSILTPSPGIGGKNGKTTKNCAALIYSGPTKRASSQLEVKSSYYRSFLGTVTFRESSSRKLERDGNDRPEGLEEYGTEHSTWTFVPSFLSYCIMLSVHKSLGPVQRSLRVRPFTRDSSAFTYCRDGNIKALQGLLTRGEVSPFSVDFHGRTLLHFAVSSLRIETCQFLLDLGLGGDETDDFNTKPIVIILFRGRYLGMDYAKRYLYQIKTLHRLLNDRSSYSRDIGELAPYLFEMCYPSRFDFPSFRDLLAMMTDLVTSENINMFYPHPAITAVKCTSRSSETDRDQWLQLALYLLRIGNEFELEDDSRYSFVHLLGFMDYSFDPFESALLGGMWLKSLHKANIDVRQYVERERIKYGNGKHHPTLFDSSVLRVLTTSWGETAELSWDWYYDPEGEAFEALHEFRHFGRWLRSDNHPRPVTPAVEWYWPYYFPQWHEDKLCSDAVRNDLKSPEVWEKRFERRWRKKEMKLARAQGYSLGPKMPGRWID